MVIFWTIISILLLALAAAFFVIQYYTSDIEKRKRVLIEAFWERRNRLPLLIELSRMAKVTLPFEKELIALREKNISETTSFMEMVNREREMKKLLQEASRMLVQSKNPLILGLLPELATVEETIAHRANDYNYVLSRRDRLYRYPWFRIFKFIGKKPQETPVAIA